MKNLIFDLLITKVTGNLYPKRFYTPQGSARHANEGRVQGFRHELEVLPDPRPSGW